MIHILYNLLVNISKDVKKSWLQEDKKKKKDMFYKCLKTFISMNKKYVRFRQVTKINIAQNSNWRTEIRTFKRKKISDV